MPALRADTRDKLRVYTEAGLLAPPTAASPFGLVDTTTKALKGKD